jgi:hypothetical protein
MIKRLIPFALALTLLAACDDSKSGPQSAAKAGGKPKIEVVGGDVVDFGTLAPGVLKRVVQFTNTGDGVLKIAEVKPACGCTTSRGLDKTELAPGDTASMEVAVDVATYANGPVSKTMTVTSNDSTRPSFAVTLKANLVRTITAEPNMFPMNPDAKAGQEVATSVALKNTGTTPVSVGPPRIDEPGEMLVRFDMTAPVVLQPGDSTTIVAHVRSLKPGIASAKVLVPTDSKEMPLVTIMLNAQAADPQQAAATPGTGR